jgi:hypothetical protein
MHGEGAPSTLLALDSDVAAMAGQDFFADRQA